jgi:hypothetical protein
MEADGARRGSVVGELVSAPGASRPGYVHAYAQVHDGHGAMRHRAGPIREGRRASLGDWGRRDDGETDEDPHQSPQDPSGDRDAGESAQLEVAHPQVGVPSGAVMLGAVVVADDLPTAPLLTEFVFGNQLLLQYVQAVNGSVFRTQDIAALAGTSVEHLQIYLQHYRLEYAQMQSPFAIVDDDNPGGQSISTQRESLPSLPSPNVIASFRSHATTHSSSFYQDTHGSNISRR